MNDPLRYGGGLARFAAALLLIAFALPLIPAAEAQTGIGPILFSEDFLSGTFDKWTTAGKGPVGGSPAPGTLSIVDGVLQIKATAGGNYDVRVSKEIRVERRYGEYRLAFDWKAVTRETPWGLDGVRVEFYDDEDRLIGQLVAVNSGQTRRGGNVLDHVRPLTLQTDRQAGIGKLAETFDWEHVTLDTSMIPGMDPSDVARLELRAWVYNDAGSGGEMHFDNFELRAGGRPPSMLSWTITTIAGNGERSFGGDGGPATATQLDRPRGVAVDGAGNLYIADTQNNRIRKVDSTGTITTVAGTWVWGFSGDGGPASEAQLANPLGVTVDGAGNLYIADSRNHRIRKVDSTGTITTVAGTGVEGFSGDGGPAVEARISFPEGVALDGAGNLYIGDTYNNRIRKVDSRGTITTIAGTGEDGFSGDGGPATEAHLYAPQSVAVDGAGNLYIGDLYNHRIRKVDSRGTITTIAGTGESGFSGDGGPATEAHLYAPHGVALDGAGNLYIADTINNRIRKLTPMTGPVTLVPVISGGSEWFSISATTPYSLTVEWKEPENTGSAITDYDVRYREVGSGGDFIDAQHEGTARTATLTGLSPGTAYEVQVRATNATGTGPWSQLGEVRTNPLQTGDHIYYFPHLAVGASWQTTITYINYSPQEVSCQTDFLSDQGSPLLVSFADRGTVVSRSDVLPPGGSVHQETNVGLTLAPGWARTTCSGPVTASLLFRQYNSAGVPVAEAGVNATRVAATRFVTFAEQGVGKAGTGVAYANPSATAALVTFTAKDAEGQVLARANRKLLAGGHDAQNMVSLFGLPSFSGSLEITSTEPIVSLSLNFEAAPVFSSLPPGEVDTAAQGTTTYYFPHLAVGASWQTTIRPRTRVRVMGRHL